MPSKKRDDRFNHPMLWVLTIGGFLCIWFHFCVTSSARRTAAQGRSERPGQASNINLNLNPYPNNAFVGPVWLSGPARFGG
jgi:hypothetical protein